MILLHMRFFTAVAPLAIVLNENQVNFLFYSIEHVLKAIPFTMI